MRVEQILSNDVFLVHDFLSPQECDEYIERAESLGFEAAPVTTALGPRMITEVRNNTRVMLEDDVLASEIFNRARTLLPTSMGVFWELQGVNERFRFYRYDPGQKFAPHYDGHFERNIHERSHLTFMLYLNEEFTGGGTKFHRDPAVTIQPKRGQALVFVHNKLHEGMPVLTGRKYVLRTDVMYRRSTAKIANFFSPQGKSASG